ncbi:MAG: SGNH/GDSL hydrolase family protein [Bacteroidales bacterium]
MKLRYSIYIFALATIISCKPELDEFELSRGSADFSTYVSLGNSHTAGFTDGALYRSGQLTSYPNLLAEQFRKVGGGSFEQPLMNGEYGIFPGKMKLGITTDCLGTTSVGPLPDTGPLDDMLQPYGKAVHNLGVPLAKSFHLLAEGYGNPSGIPMGTANPFYVRFASSPQSSVLQDAMTLSPTFFSLWIGSNDILSYATAGGEGTAITEINTFNFAMQTIISNLTASGAKGVIANIPDPSSMPFFNTVPYNALVLIQQQQVDALNEAYGNGAIGITFKLGANPFVIADPASQAGIRQMIAGELVLLSIPQDSLKCAGWGSAKPIPGQYVLTAAEISTINATITAYNQIIGNMANDYGLAFADMSEFMKELSSGIIYNGETFTLTYVTGNAFSLDGIHFTPKGYALIANQFITAINRKYGAGIPLVDVTKYRGNILP